MEDQQVPTDIDEFMVSLINEILCALFGLVLHFWLCLHSWVTHWITLIMGLVIFDWTAFVLFIQFHPFFMLVVKEQVQWIVQFFKPLHDIFDNATLGIMAQQIRNVCHVNPFSWFYLVLFILYSNLIVFAICHYFCSVIVILMLLEFSLMEQEFTEFRESDKSLKHELGSI